MTERGQQTPTVGELVPYLVTKGEGKICEKADHPDFVDKDNIDYNYYIEGQIYKPLQNTLAILDRNWRVNII